MKGTVLPTGTQRHTSKLASQYLSHAKQNLKSTELRVV